ncbi:hybrid sensor histidine kinase/response regulator [Tindallia californiensis]|uniref:Circadian input-output histidine kinase CikA n=1 Tax=Tindallia californiensis TaxID=159292 RepID=A0A1H3MFL8_9FIRM|nr:ATP-binding protein [Tindallia californiensis]SDY75373.1 PAS domain S-box-containing protein [Tindallia californiensis]
MKTINNKGCGCLMIENSEQSLIGKVVKLEKKVKEMETNSFISSEETPYFEAVKEIVNGSKEISMQLQQFYHIIDGLDYPFYLIEANTFRVLLANKKAMGDRKSLLEEGISCHELTHDRLKPCDPKDHPCALLEVLEKKKAVKLEHKHKNVDETIQDVEVHAHPIFNADGEIHQVLEYVLDITERKKTEEELEKREALLRASQKITKTGAWEWDLEKKTMYWTEETYLIHGMEREELMPGSPEHIEKSMQGYERDDIPKIADAFRKCCNQGKAYDMELPYTRSDGEKIWIRTTAEPVIEEGKVKKVIGTFVDITQRKETELALKIAKEEAEKANDAKSRFLANMSHEIRNPMNAIIGLTHLLLKKENDVSLHHEYLQKISAVSKSLMNLINDILDFSKIEAGEMTLENQSFNLEDVMEQVKTVSMTAAKEKGIPLLVDVEAGTPVILTGDAFRLEQILTNLVSNAIKFTEKGKVSLHVRAEGLLEEGKEKIVFTISDTGIGMTKIQAENLFKPYQQAEVTTSRRYGGTGLGLAISRYLVEQMGGMLTVRSALGVGSTFTCAITFKMAEEREKPYGKAVKKMPIEPDTVEESLLKGKRILVVDDDEVNQLVAKGIMKEWGIETEVASDGETAIQKVEEKEYHAVLMDLRMHKMNGLIAVRKMRHTKSKEALPVIAMTADAMEEDRKKTLAAGMNDHLTKPIDPQKLFELLLYWTSEKAVSPKEEKEDCEQEKAQISEGCSKEIIPGISISEGVERFLGDEALFMQILEHTWKHWKEMNDKIKTAYQRKDNSLLKVQVHKIKGTSGNISANRLYHAAAELESNLLKNQLVHLDLYYKEFQAAMEEVMIGLEVLFNNQPSEK